MIRQFAERPALVVKAYSRAYPNPLRGAKGEVLTITPKESDFPGWLWCTSPAGVSGWVPEEFVTRDGDRAVLLRDYDAVELTVNVGELVTVLEGVAGWSWCRTASRELGWVPNDSLSL